MAQGERSSAHLGVDVARLLLLRRVQREAPGVLLDLRDSVLSAWDRPPSPPLSPRRLQPVITKSGMRALWDVGKLDRDRVSVSAVDALNVWAARWNLSAPWVTEAGWETCVFWLRHPETLRMGAPEWSPETMARLKPVPAEDRVIEGWDPSLESEQAFHERIEKHVARVLDYASNQGWRAALELRTWWRFDWLVWYQVLGLSWNEISLRDAETPNRETVQTSVSRIAELVELPVRPPADD
jgi:hypothetical protein